MAADGVICEGDHLVLDVNGEKLSFVQKLKARGKIWVGKFHLPAAQLIGEPYGALFEVTTDGKSLQRVLLPPADEITRITETEKNNSVLFDRNGDNQKLTQEEILELRKTGKAGAEIIQALCSNSTTFKNKTEFAQDKYKKRKAKKYLTYLTVRRPCARIICEAYYEKAPERVWNLRHDSLAVLLSLANVAAGAKVLVSEQCMGVLTSAAVERLGGTGVVCALQADERPAPLDAVRQMNLSAAQRSVLFTAPVASLLRDKAAAEKKAQVCSSAAAAATSGGPVPNGTVDAPSQQQQQEQGRQQQAQEQQQVGEQVSEPPQQQQQQQEQQAAGGVSETEAGGPGSAGAMEVEAAALGEASLAGQPNSVPTALMEAREGEGATAMDVEAAAAGTSGGREADAASGEVAEAGAGAEEDRTGGVASGSSPAEKLETELEVGEGEQAGRQQQRDGGSGARGGYGSFPPQPHHLQAVLTSGFDSCMVAMPRVHPTALLASIWPLLAPSATFAVFSPWPQPLAEAMTHLQVSRNAVLLQLQESWLRPYQVLPARTHPHMSCSGTGGYILSGIKVISPDAVPLEAQLQQHFGRSVPTPQLLNPQDLPTRPLGTRQQEEAGPATADDEEGKGAAVADEEQLPKGSPGDGGSRGRGNGRGGCGRGGNGDKWRGRRGGRGQWRDNRSGDRGVEHFKRKAEDGAAGGDGGGDLPASKRQAT